MEMKWEWDGIGLEMEWKWNEDGNIQKFVIELKMEQK